MQMDKHSSGMDFVTLLKCCFNVPDGFYLWRKGNRECREKVMFGRYWARLAWWFIGGSYQIEADAFHKWKKKCENIFTVVKIGETRQQNRKWRASIAWIMEIATKFMRKMRWIFWNADLYSFNIGSTCQNKNLQFHYILMEFLRKRVRKEGKNGIYSIGERKISARYARNMQKGSSFMIKKRWRKKWLKKGKEIWRNRETISFPIHVRNNNKNREENVLCARKLHKSDYYHLHEINSVEKTHTHTQILCVVSSFGIELTIR